MSLRRNGTEPSRIATFTVEPVAEESERASSFSDESSTDDEGYNTTVRRGNHQSSPSDVTATAEERERDRCSRALRGKDSLPLRDHKQLTGKMLSILITSTYALVMIIMALIIEAAPEFKNHLIAIDTVFFSYMYGMALIFLAYCYLFIFYPFMYNDYLLPRLKRIFRAKIGRWRVGTPRYNTDHVAILYLRIGAMMFCIIACVLCVLEIVFCRYAPTHCRPAEIARLVLTIVFILWQMHFMFCKTNVQIYGPVPWFTRFGLMHLVAVNLWTWFRFVIAKNAVKALKKQKKYARNAQGVMVEYDDSSSEEDMLSDVLETTLASVLQAVTGAPETTTVMGEVTKPTNTTTTTTPEPIFGNLYSSEYLNDFSSLLTTCVVEYSLVGAAVTLILWFGTGRSEDDRNHDSHSSTEHNEMRGTLKSNLKIDCSSSHYGIFCGVMFAITAGACLILYYIFDSIHRESAANAIISSVILALNVVATIALGFGFFRLRHLDWNPHSHGDAGAVDSVLLYIGFLGEIVYILICIQLYITRCSYDPMPYYQIFMYSFRFVNVVIQLVFITLAVRLHCVSHYAQMNKPGKQIVSFLVLANLTLFILHTFADTASPMGLGKCGSEAYPMMVYAVAPLTVFYRFHSSASLAEIWGHCYHTHEHGHGHGEEHGHGHGHGHDAEEGHGSADMGITVLPEDHGVRARHPSSHSLHPPSQPLPMRREMSRLGRAFTMTSLHE